MHNITTVTELRHAIKELEEKQAVEWPLLKEQFFTTYESFKLINVLKHTIKEAISAPDLKNNVINTAIGLTTGILARKTLIGKTYNPLKKLAGVILEMTVANKIANNGDKIKSIGSIVFNKILHFRSNSKKD
ncbi:MAG: hypothetical protein ACKVOW_07550 [Chitinophagaceae bacterium]